MGILTGDRVAIAAALDYMEGVTGYEFRPTTPRPGDAWPLLGALERGPASAFTVNWNVYVVLPADERAASQWIDDRVDELVGELEPVGFVDRVEPVKLDINNDQTAYGLLVTIRGE